MPNPTHRRAFEFFRWLAFAACVAAVAAGVLVSCTTLQRTELKPPEIPGASFVGNAACADCHKEYTRRFAGSPHARIHIEGANSATGCESCHGPGSKHVALPSAKGGIVNPRREAGACFACHVQTHAEFNLPQHHPVTEGKMNCVQCHDPHGADMRKPARGLGFARINEGCAECHREQARPFIYEHEAMREGCTSCHQPHGSVNRAMLVQNDSNLCLKCHAQTQGSGGQLYIGKVNHSDNVRLGGCWTAGCHSAVHGSNVNRRMLY